MEKKSNIGEILSGVPQGSILGPLLFLVFVNDLPLALSKKIFATDLYADDTTFYDIQPDLETLRSNLQESLLILQRWCRQNGMLLNTGKTKVMLITTRQRRIRLDASYSRFLTMKLICSSQQAIRYWVCILRRIFNGITISNMFAKKFHLTFGSCLK